jgi:hypothetical protein
VHTCAPRPRAGRLTALNYLGDVPALDTSKRAALDADLEAESLTYVIDEEAHTLTFDPKLKTAQIGFAAALVEAHGLKKGLYQAAAGRNGGEERGPQLRGRARERHRATPSP